MKNQDKEKALGMLITVTGVTYIVYKLSETALRLVPISKQNRDAYIAKYKKWINGGLIIVGLGAGSAVQYYGYNFSWLVEQFGNKAYYGLALGIAGALVGEFSCVRAFLFGLPEKVKTAVTNNPKKSLGIGAVLTAGTATLLKPSWRDAAFNVASSVAGIARNCGTSIFNSACTHPREAVFTALLLGGARLAAYKFGFKKNSNSISSFDNKIAKIEKTLKGNPTDKQKADLKKQLVEITTAIDKINTQLEEQSKVLINNKDKSAEKKKIDTLITNYDKIAEKADSLRKSI